VSDSGIIALNIPEVAGALASYPQIARPEYQAATEASLLLNIPELAEYPPQGSSTYRRTGTLGREWTTATPEWQASSSGFEGTLGNNTPYGPYVQDDERQARRLAARWRNTPKRVVTRNTNRIEANYKVAVERIAEKINRVTK
jgi:hypothetical protein